MQTLMLNLNEGGAAGHMMHPFDDESIKLSELIEMIADIGDAKLSDVSEKVDGFNIMFTADANGLKLARNLGDVRSGGVDAKTLLARFAGRETVERGFRDAVEKLHRAVSQAGASAARASKNGELWFSAEAISSSSENVIPYSRSTVIVHDSPVMTRSGEKTSDSVAAQLMRSAIGAEAGADVSGPLPKQLRGSKESARIAAAAVRRAASEAGVSLELTIGDFIKQRVAAATGDEKLANAAAYKSVSKLQGAALRARKNAIEPLEAAITELSAAVLHTMSSALVDDASSAMKIIKDKIDAAVSKIERSGDAVAAESLKKEMTSLARLGSPSAIEGLVFRRGDRTYKLTGVFPILNRIVHLALKLSS